MKYLLAIIALLGFISPITAHASACPNVEVIFARGTGEPYGVGEVGQAFADALHPDSVYPVDYPASMDFRNSILQGVGDAAGHIEGLVARCPGVKIILSGFSQGAALAAFTTSDEAPAGVDLQPLSDSAARRIRAVVVFGLPNEGFTNMLGVQPAVMGSRFVGKSFQACIPGDPVCDGGGDWALHNEYPSNMADAVAFARNHL